MKLALIVTVLAVLMVTVPAVYTNVINRKTEIPNISTTQITKVPTEIADINTSVLIQMTKVPTEIADINTHVLTQMIEEPTANRHLTSFGM